MSFDDVRPILSGLVGGVVALWLGRAVSRRQQARLGEQRIESLGAFGLTAALMRLLR